MPTNVYLIKIILLTWIK